MKKGITTLFLGLAFAAGAQAQEYNLFHDVDADGWLWFDTQEKIDKYVGLCDEENYCVDSDGKPIQLVYADIYPDYPQATADPFFWGVGTDGEDFGTAGYLTGALVLPGSSGLTQTNGGGFVVCMPSCSSFSICLSTGYSVYCRMLGSRDANAKFSNVVTGTSTFTNGAYINMSAHSVLNSLCGAGIYTWDGIENLNGGYDNPDVLKGDQPVYAYFQNNRNQEVYIHGIRVTTPTNSTVSVRDVTAKQQNRIFFEGNRVVLNEPADIKVYNANGLLMDAAAHADCMDLSDMPKGIYIVKAGDATRKLAVQ